MRHLQDSKPASPTNESFLESETIFNWLATSKHFWWSSNWRLFLLWSGSWINFRRLALQNLTSAAPPSSQTSLHIVCTCHEFCAWQLSVLLSRECDPYLAEGIATARLSITLVLCLAKAFCFFAVLRSDLVTLWVWNSAVDRWTPFWRLRILRTSFLSAV